MTEDVDGGAGAGHAEPATDDTAEVVICEGCGDEFLRRNATRIVKVNSDGMWIHHKNADEDRCPRKGCHYPVEESKRIQYKRTGASIPIEVSEQ